jgi:hypothetical protein
MLDLTSPQTKLRHNAATTHDVRQLPLDLAIQTLNNFFYMYLLIG